jgi:SAM-dependent methyltransferase
MLTPLDDSEFWDNLYEQGESNWDLKSPNPVFKSLLEGGNIIQPGSILITGSGKGYDAVAAAKAGYTVTAVDFSQNAVDHTRKLAEVESVNLNVMQENVFNLNNVLNEQFDIVYEYTTFCAINPARREEFASVISALIKPGGKFVSVVFPIDGREGGPPFSIDPVQFYKLFSRYLKLEFSSRRIESVKPRKGKEILQVYIKPLNGMQV